MKTSHWLHGYGSSLFSLAWRGQPESQYFWCWHPPLPGWKYHAIWPNRSECSICSNKSVSPTLRPPNLFFFAIKLRIRSVFVGGGQTKFHFKMRTFFHKRELFLGMPNANWSMNEASMTFLSVRLMGNLIGYCNSHANIPGSCLVMHSWLTNFWDRVGQGGSVRDRVRV